PTAWGRCSCRALRGWPPSYSPRTISGSSRAGPGFLRAVAVQDNPGRAVGSGEVADRAHDGHRDRIFADRHMRPRGGVSVQALEWLGRVAFHVFGDGEQHGGGHRFEEAARAAEDVGWATMSVAEEMRPIRPCRVTLWGTGSHPGWTGLPGPSF